MTFETEWPSQSATGPPTTAGSGETGVRPSHVQARTSTSPTSRSKLEAQHLALHLDLRLAQQTTLLAMPVLPSLRTSATGIVTVDGAGPQMTLPSGAPPTPTADASDDNEL
jgi:hypothetical protein